MTTMAERRLRIGVAGLGRAFTLMLPTLAADSRIELVAAADPRADARTRFATDFAARTYPSVDELCADPDVEAVYIATPHQDHAGHVVLAESLGKHVLVEKPMAITLDECLRMITAQYYTDFLYRPRRPEELVTERGGGVVFSQGAHQIDIVRLLGGGTVRSVRALTGAWDPARPTEGAYAALLTFGGGAFASLTYSGYARFDGDEFCGGIGELGVPKDPSAYGAARRALRQVTTTAEETDLKNARNYGGTDYSNRAASISQARMNPAAVAPWHQHFGWMLVSCEHADLRPLPTGVMIYGDTEVRLEPLPKPDVPRAEVIDELYGAVVRGQSPLHDGRWAMATLEVCLALLQSARERRDVELVHQGGRSALR